jgi:predicted nucleic acid-binding Zn ribbon protein
MIRSTLVTMQAIGQVLPRAIAEIVRQAPLSAGKVDFAWRSSVGTAMARASSVLLVDGVLIVETQTPQWAAAIRRASVTILRRLQDLLGAETIREIRLRT